MTLPIKFNGCMTSVVWVGAKCLKSSKAHAWLHGGAPGTMGELHVLLVRCGIGQAVSDLGERDTGFFSHWQPYLFWLLWWSVSRRICPCLCVLRKHEVTRSWKPSCVSHRPDTTDPRKECAQPIFFTTISYYLRGGV